MQLVSWTLFSLAHRPSHCLRYQYTVRDFRYKPDPPEDIDVSPDNVCPVLPFVAHTQNLFTPVAAGLYTIHSSRKPLREGRKVIPRFLRCSTTPCSSANTPSPYTAKPSDLSRCATRRGGA